MDLCQLETLKTRLELDDTTHDNVLTYLIGVVSKEAENYLGRTIDSSATANVEYFDVAPGQYIFSLPAYPVTSITSVYNDPDWTYGSSTAVDASNYKVNSENGILYVDAGFILSGFQALKVTYKGGMADDTSEFESNYPDLADAVCRQVSFLWSTRKEVGFATVNAGQGSMTLPYQQTWLPDVKAILDRYRRRVA